jgi:hypothetical protein
VGYGRVQVCFVRLFVDYCFFIFFFIGLLGGERGEVFLEIFFFLYIQRVVFRFGA